MNRKTILVSAFMVVLLVGTFGATMYNLGSSNTKPLYLQEGLESGDGDFEGYMTFTVVKEDGSRIIAWEGHNAITTAGLNAIREQISGTQTADFDYIAIGTGTGGTTALNAEIFRQQGTYAAGATGVFTITEVFTAGTFSGQVVTEAGCLNAASTGILLNYQTFTGITLTVTDSLEVEFEFTIS